ncbi:MAG: hypothetical protein PVI98_07105 [Burkholderiales bacterium]
MHRIHHVPEHRIEDGARFFRIAIGQQFHRSGQIGKQDRDLLAFTFKGSARAEDLVAQVFWCMCVWRSRAHRGICAAELGAAFAAEFMLRRIDHAARWARRRQAGSALTAEFQA